MKYLIPIFIFLLITNWCEAQEFDKAPLPKVKKIVEWIQIDKNKKADKGITYHFDSNGLLTQYEQNYKKVNNSTCLLYTSPSPRDATLSRMPSSA